MKEENTEQNIVKPWQPTYKRMGITAAVIVVVLIITFFLLNIILKPYMRQRPAELTPWLDKGAEVSSASGAVSSETLVTPGEAFVEE